MVSLSSVVRKARKKVMMSRQHSSQILEGFVFVVYGLCPPNQQDTHQKKEGKILDTINQLSGKHQNQILIEIVVPNWPTQWRDHWPQFSKISSPRNNLKCSIIF